MAAKIPATVVTGFLGAGKTTLIRHMLQNAQGKRIALIINEFGDLGVDGDILKGCGEEVCSKDDIVELSNGCICCTVRGDLVKSLKKLYKKIAKFDAVIIETTGLADPAPVAQTFFVDEEISQTYKLDGIVTFIDSKHIMQHLDEEKPEGVENESVEQVAFADRILLNKIDLVKDTSELDAIEGRLKAINSQAQIFRCERSQVAPQNLINVGAFDIDRVLKMEPDFMNTEGEHEHDPTVSSCSCRFEGELNVNKLNRWIGELMRTKATDLFRYKGVLAVKGMDQKFVFQGVHMIFDGNFDVTKWKAEEKRECRFVFIGRNLDKEALIAGIMACQVVRELRFKIGDLVEANVGTWKPGKIIHCWDDGNPYRIEIDDEEKTNVWGPVDEDAFVRARR